MAVSTASNAYWTWCCTAVAMLMRATTAHRTLAPGVRAAACQWDVNCKRLKALAVLDGTAGSRTDCEGTSSDGLACSPCTGPECSSSASAPCLTCREVAKQSWYSLASRG